LLQPAFQYHVNVGDDSVLSNAPVLAQDKAKIPSFNEAMKSRPGNGRMMRASHSIACLRPTERPQIK
jgi:hypothetical protein